MDPDRAYPIRTGSSNFQSNVASGHARMHNGDVYNVTYSGTAPQSLREQIMDSLWFDMMEARQDNIKGATPNTLDWIYDSDSEDLGSQISDSEDKNQQDSDSEGHEQLDPAGEDRDAQDPYNGDQDGQDSSSESQDDQNSVNDQAEQWQHRESRRRRDWDSLAKWLKEDDSIYWVCGKAASGKSTLMAHIVNDDRTRDCLSKWAKGKLLHILKFFFWRPGTELQKSITGLLRALLYQICDKLQHATSHVVEASRWNPRQQKPWSDKHLISAIRTALTSSGDVFCLFLDGLDEFVGDLSILMELVYQLEDLENVKVCVSSRPEAELTANFFCCKQLRLERLNRADIHIFVEEKLHHLREMPVFTTSEDETYHDFVDQVVSHAAGVFLWAVLVLPMLVKGISSYDDWEMLQTRLATTPSAINDLYANMLAKLDSLHQESFYFYLELMKILGRNGPFEPTVAQITAARIGEDLLNMSYEAFLKACGQEKRRVISRSVGLLQITEARRGRNIDKCVAIGQLTARGGMSSTHIDSARDAAKLRRPMDWSVLNAEAHISAHNEYLEWIHRSAHDFIFPPDGSVSPMCDSHFDRADVWKKFLLGGVNLLAVSPSFVGNPEEINRPSVDSSRQLSTLIQILDRVANAETAMAVDIAKETRLVLCNMHNEDFHLPQSCEGLVASADAFEFWFTCFRYDACSILQALLPALLSEPAGNALFMPLWHEIYKHPSDTTLARVIMPFLERIEQNIWLPGEANARVVLYFRGEEGLEGLYHRRVSHISCIVPDFLGSSQPAAMHLFFEECYSSTSAKFPEVVVAYFDRVAPSVRLFSDFEMQPPIIYPPEAQDYRMLLQCSYQLKRWLCSDAVASDHNTKYCDEFRVVCLPAGYRICGDDVFFPDNVEYGERRSFIHFAPSPRTCACFLQAIRQAVTEGPRWGFELSDDTMLRQWTQMLVEDIWENSQGLDATQQLFALACVKWTIPRWLNGVVKVKRYQ